jgi:hypothetical protein
MVTSELESVKNREKIGNALLEVIGPGNGGHEREMALSSLSDHRPTDASLGESSGEAAPSASLYPRTSIRSDEPPVQASLMASLPPRDTKRWVVRRKAAVVAAVRTGGITVEEACRYYRLSEEELLSWTRAFETHGLAGLRATRIQQYRLPRSARPGPRR